MLGSLATSVRLALQASALACTCVLVMFQDSMEAHVSMHACMCAGCAGERAEGRAGAGGVSAQSAQPLPHGPHLASLVLGSHLHLAVHSLAGGRGHTAHKSAVEIS